MSALLRDLNFLWGLYALIFCVGYFISPHIKEEMELFQKFSPWIAMFFFKIIPIKHSAGIAPAATSCSAVLFYDIDKNNILKKYIEKYVCFFD